jgi:tetratricopeptide (TPR) repeat protein
MSVVAASVLAIVMAPGSPPEPIAWQKDLRHALKVAHQTQRVVMIDFWAQWCSWCQQLDTDTYSDPQVVALSRNFVAVKVNTEGGLADMEATERYHVSTLPTILFLTPAGTPLMRVADFQDAQRFADTLQKAGAKGHDLMDIERALSQDARDPAALAALGHHLLEQGELPRSRECLDKSARVDASLPAARRQETRLLLGRVHVLEGRYEDAVRVLREAQGLDPEGALVPEVLLELGRAYASLDERQEARAALTGVVRKHADTPAAREAQALIATLDDPRKR